MSTCANRECEVDSFVYVVPGRTDSSSRGASSLEAWRGTEHILFVDDEESLVAVTRGMLEHLGYTVTALNDPHTCLESSPEQMSEYSLIITDHFMPEMNGMDLIDELRRRNPVIPVILCTGHADPDIKSRLQEIGSSGLVTKPYTLPQLGETVRRVLDCANLLHQSP